MKLLILFVATIYIAFLPTSLSVLVPQASEIDSTLSKNEDRFKAYLTMDSREQNELDLKNTVEYSPNSTEQNLNSNVSGSNHEAFLHKRLYYLIFFLPYTTGNVSKWQKSHYHGKAFGNTSDKGINHENVADGVVSEENTKILNRKTIYPHWYVMHTPSNNKNATNGASKMKQYNGISGPTDLIQPHTARNVSEWQKSSNEEDAMGNAHHKGVNRYENGTEDVAFDENIKVLNNKTSYPRWYVTHVPTIHKANVANGDSNKEQYSDIAKGKFEPTDDSHVKGDIGNSEGKNMETVESKGKHTNVIYKKYLKIFFGNKQNSNLNNESEIPIFKSLFAKLFNDGRKNGELNKDSKVSSKIDFKTNNGSNGKSREATGVIQPGQKEHKANYQKYSFHPHFGEYSEDITTQNTHGLIYEMSGKTEESNEPFQMNDTRENHPRKKGNGEGHENRAHAAYFMSDKQASFFRQKRQVKTHKESEGRDQGKSSGNLHDIRIERPLGNTSKSSGNTIGTPSNNASAMDSDLVKKMQNNSPARGKAPIEDTVNKISKENGAPIFNPNPLTPEIFNGSITSTKNLNAFSKSDSNKPDSFHLIRSNSNLREAVNFNRGYQKDIKSTEEGKIIPESVPRSTKISAETTVGIIGNHSISEAKITTVKYSDIKNEREKTRNRNGTTTKPIQVVLNGNTSDTKVDSKMFSNNTSHISYRNERFPGKHPFLKIDLMEDIEERINKSFLVVKETVKPDEIHHTNNLSIEEQKEPDVMYRSYENFNVTLLPVIQPFNISKKDSPDIEIQVPTMTEGTGRANITTQNPVIHTGIKNEEVIYRKSDNHKYKDRIQTKAKKDVLMNENITVPKIPLHHTNSTSGAAAKNMDKAAYRNNDDRKSLETVTDKTHVVNRSNNGEAKESNQTTLNDNLGSTSGAERKNIEAVAYRNNDDRKPHETIAGETEVANRSDNGEAKESNQTALNDNLGNTAGAERKNNEAVASRSNDERKSHETIAGETEVANRSDNGEVKESNQTTLNDNLGSTPGAEVKNIEAVAYRNDDDRKSLETITGETQIVNRSNNGGANESNQTTLNDNLERNSTGSHLMKEVTLNVPKTEQSQTYENITTKEITPETETRFGPIDDPLHVNRRTAGDTTNHRMKHEILYLPKQLVGTDDKNNTETKITNQGMLYSDKLNATRGNLNESDGTKIQLQQHMLPEQMQNFTDNISFKKFIFAAEAASGSRTKESNAYMTTESVIDNQQENTPNKQMQRVNRNTNMTGWFERKQWNAEKEASGMKTVRPSMLDKTKGDHMNEKAAAPKNSKDAHAHSRYILQNREKRANSTYEANPIVSDNSGANLVTETDKFRLVDFKETVVTKN